MMFYKTKNMFLRTAILTILVFSMTNQMASQVVNPSFGKGINFNAPDSSMSVKMQFRIQTLFTGETLLDDSQDWTTNALVRRARLKFDGFMVDPRFRYKIELGLSNRDISPSSDFEEVRAGSKIVLDAVGKYAITDNIDLWIGQTKLPGNRERLLSSQKLDLVDRSLLNSKFNIDRDMGIQLRGIINVGNALLRPQFALSKGEGRNITADNIGGFEYTGKVEFLPMGKFTKGGDYVGADLAREATPKLALAVAYDINQGASRQQGNLGSFLVDSLGNHLETDLSGIFADAMFKYQGLMLMVEYAQRSISENIVADNGKGYYTGSALNVHTSYLFDCDWAVSGRFTQIKPDNQTYSGVTETAEYTLGISRYIKGHSLKFQSDASLIDVQGASDMKLRIRFQMEIAI
jgi:phosphate-selective porin OprO and OprP